MRQHKYRLIHKDKIVGYEKWYPGERHNPDSGMRRWVARPCWLYSVSGKGWTPDYIFHESKDEFTDKLDKNGKEIYEGDRIRGRVFLNDGYDKTGWIVNGTVSWDKDFAVWIFANIKTPVENYHSMLWQIEEIEVIGNIHETPVEGAKP